MDLKALKRKAHELQGELVAAKKAKSEAASAALMANRAVTDEDRKAIAEATAKVDELEAKAVELQGAIAAAQEAEDAQRAYVASGAVESSATMDVRPLQVGKDLSEEDPKRGFRTSNDFLVSVMRAYQTNRVDARLRKLQATAGSDEQMGASDPYGGFLLPVAFSPDLLSIQGEADPTVAFTRKLPMDAPMVKINARVDKDHSTSVSGGLVVYRHSETAEVTPSRMSFEQLSFEAHELMGAAYATESVLVDSPNTFVALIATGFKDEFAAKILKEKLVGVGAAGQFIGVIGAGCAIDLAKETNQKAATIVKENIDGMAERVWRYGSAIWLANHNTRKQLKSLVQVVGTGGQPVPYFTTVNGQDYLDGRPIFFTEHCKTLGTSGDLILGNWSEYIEGTYQPMQQAESIHVRFLNNERAFKFWLRNAGMPWWRSVLTPANGATLSPFVTLAVRS
jgi:HK97 family phage major capsid protein